MVWIAYGWIVLVWDSFLFEFVHVDVAACVRAKQQESCFENVSGDKHKHQLRFRCHNLMYQTKMVHILTYEHTQNRKIVLFLRFKLKYSVFIFGFYVGSEASRENTVFARSYDIAQRYVHHTLTHEPFNIN